MIHAREMLEHPVITEMERWGEMRRRRVILSGVRSTKSKNPYFGRMWSSAPTRGTALSGRSMTAPTRGTDPSTRLRLARDDRGGTRVRSG